jgi:DNA ligase (NAD+)
MTDAAYDDGIEALRIAVAQDPTLAAEVADLLGQVAVGQSAGGDVEHTSLMGSMDKANSFDTVRAFVAKVGGQVVVEPKLDGMAVSATYRAGRLVAMTTRGDGHSGEDVTDRAPRITGLPATITDTDDREVRGEVFMSAADFTVTNEARVASSKLAFINPRNAVAGALRKSSPTHAVRMSFAAYESTSPLPSHLARMIDLEGLGFAVAYRLLGEADVTAYGVGRVLALIDGFDKVRNIDVPADGIVVKADADTDRRQLGMCSRAPKWAIAYKYDAEAATTVVQDIEISLGRTGRLALRARVTPVFVGGTTITYASLHNVSWLAERDIRVGDTVNIKRANDVIPYIESAILADRPADAQRWVAPATCPQRGEPWNTDTLLWRCLSPECSTLGRIVYAAARDCLDIEGLGTEVATALVESGKVNDIADLFTLTVADLASLVLDGRLLGAKNAAKVHAEIVKAKSAAWSRVITQGPVKVVFQQVRSSRTGLVASRA